MIYPRQSLSVPDDSPSESSGFGDRRRAIRLPLRGPGKDEPSLATSVAIVVMANEWASSLLKRELRDPAQCAVHTSDAKNGPK